MYSSAKKLQRVLSAGEIRKTFIDYFTVHHDHKYVRSSPVVPFCDPTVAFVNAGMNQFKSIFLGKAQAPYPRVANSQKCVRVGGKHNDLNVVGEDGYHHTFFEMLGNWSFGDYFKREACEMALTLLRGPYNIDTNRLYVTYFAGDNVLGLPADLECFEIWRSLGFPSNRILPFGCKDNFWEMGSTGPCGPCTEIHYDHRPDLGGSYERAKLVNAGRPDLTELWNLVFIQYNRNANGTISTLPAKHVDTGMGFERLTALLQQKTSNYDTDLFSPIFDAIQKNSKVPPYNGRFPSLNDNASLDIAYRIMADHARMVAICLSDGMLPDQNQKLRRVLRKALKVSEQVFANEKLIFQLIPVVVDILGPAYPELYRRQESTLDLLAHEQDVYKSIRDSSAKAFSEVLTEFPGLKDIDLMEHPGLLPAYRDFKTQKINFSNRIIPGKFLFKLSDTYGVSEEYFEKFAELENMSCDLIGYREEIVNAKLRTKNAHLNSSISDAMSNVTKGLPSTLNSFKYDYTYDPTKKQYNIPRIKAKILGMLLNEKQIQIINKNDLEFCEKETEATISIVTDKSNFYYESGGQQSDAGKILVNSELKFSVVDVKLVNNCVVHVCKIDMSEAKTNSLQDVKLQLGDEVTMVIDNEHRKNNMCHHTATHLLNGAIRSLFQKVTYQVSSAVTSDHCKLEVGLIGKRLVKEDVTLIEDLIGHIICTATPVNVRAINASDVLQNDDITMVPGEIYPETNLRLIEIECEQPELISKELCCGTHVTNTQELEHFCITNLKLTNRARYAFTAVAGSLAEKVLKSAALLQHRVNVLELQCQTDKLTNATETELQKIRNTILHTADLVLPYTMRITTLERITELLKRIKETTRTTLNEFVEVEMKNLLQEKPKDKHPFLLHYICSSALVEDVPLQRATKLCTDRPILVVVMCDRVVRARCCVPKNFVTENFDAEKWLRVFADVFSAQIIVQKGQDSAKVCNMKGKKVSTQFEEQLEIAMATANEFAQQQM